MERKVSEMTSRRCKASAAKHAIQAAFICGRAATLLRPLSTKVGTGWLPVAKLSPLWWPPRSVVKKHLVHNQRQAMLPAQFFDRSPLRGAGEVSRRIIGVD